MQLPAVLASILSLAAFGAATPVAAAVEPRATFAAYVGGPCSTEGKPSLPSLTKLCSNN